MITASELRIGNYVMFAGHVDIVNAIDEERIVYCQSLHAGRQDNQFNGIPLTEEWLLKFGFKLNALGNYEARKKKADFNHETKSVVTIKKAYYFKNPTVGPYWLMHGPLIKHVHQLQNLYFALTGTELTIKELVK